MEDDVLKDDVLDGIITDRLAARQRMVERMNGWERQGKWRKPLYAAVAVAACAAGLMLTWPMQQPPSSPLDELGITISVPAYRAGSPETARIEKLIAQEEYEKALDLTRQMLEDSDEFADKLQWIETGNGNDGDEVDYMLQMEMVHNCELRWTYICLLTRAEQWEGARRELRRYLKHKHFCEHETEARQLLKVLKGKKS